MIEDKNISGELNCAYCGQSMSNMAWKDIDKHVDACKERDE